MQIKGKKLFLFQLQICGSSSACRKKTRCRRMARVPPFWDICKWKNFSENLNTWPNTSSKRFFLPPFLQSKKKFPKIYAVTLMFPLKEVSQISVTILKWFLWFVSQYVPLRDHPTLSTSKNCWLAVSAIFLQFFVEKTLNAFFWKPIFSCFVDPFSKTTGPIFTKFYRHIRHKYIYCWT